MKPPLDKLAPWQFPMVKMMLAIPEGHGPKLIFGRGGGMFAQKDGKVTHRWNGEAFVLLE